MNSRSARTEDDLVDDEAVLVDQSRLDERSSEPDAALCERCPPERSCFRRVSARSPVSIVVSPQSADVSEYKGSLWHTSGFARRLAWHGGGIAPRNPPAERQNSA